MRSIHVAFAGFLPFFVAACGDDFGSLDAPETVGESRDAASLERVPGLVMGLLHDANQAPAGKVMYSASPLEAAQQRGGDLGAPQHRGFEWWSLFDPAPAPDSSFYATRLPPGVVVALKHNENQSGQTITAFGRDAWTGPASFPGFQRQVGGDRGASSGVGYAWYESTGSSFTAWSEIDSILPKYTVVGLKHSQNQPSKVLRWNGVVFDPVKTSPVPAGFRRMVGGDLGAPSGQGYYWYEKTTGTEIVTEPSLRRTLARSMFLQPGETGSLDRDGDCLVDSVEGELSSWFRPYTRFDSHETARQPFEPIVVFRSYPTSNTTLHVKWLALFRQDGGYGPGDLVCQSEQSHVGDNDSIDYDFSTSDGGRTWTLTKVEVGDRGLDWKSDSRLEVYDKRHPVVYMSGSKHHEYFTRDWDEQDSLYGSFPFYCDDNVDGKGAGVLTSTFNILVSLPNNVGEANAHPTSDFVDSLEAFFPGQRVWGAQGFYSMGPNENKLKAPVAAACPSNGCAHGPCGTGAALSPSCFSEVAEVCSLDPYCCNVAWDALCVLEVPSGCGTNL